MPKGRHFPQIAGKYRSKKTVLYTVSFNIEGNVSQRAGDAISASTTERDSVLPEVNGFYKKARPNIEMRAVKILHNNAPAHKSKLVQ